MAPKGSAHAARHSWSPVEETEQFSGEIEVHEERIVATSSAPCSNEFNDAFSVLVRQGSDGPALYSVLAFSGIVSLVSFMLVFQYEPPLNQGEVHVNLWNNVCSPRQGKAVWADLLTEQIEILQNLIHASLLGGAALVAAYRGDVVWLFFVRNCIFYFTLTATSFLVVDTVSRDLSGRWVVATLFCSVGIFAFVKLEGVCQSLRSLQGRLFEERTTTALAAKERVGSDNLMIPNYQAKTPYDQSRAKVIFQSAVVVQIVSTVYVACTTALAVLPLQQCDYNVAPTSPHRRVEGVVADMQRGGSTSLSPFEMGYSLGAHEAFLLALFMLASTFPRCPASVGGALLGSAWRFLLACCSLSSLLSNEFTISDMRKGMSLFFLLVEAASMIPILVASLQLTLEADTFRTVLGRTTTNLQTGAGKYIPISRSDAGDGNPLCDEAETGCSISESTEERCFHRIPVPTLRLICSSHRFSTRQRFGASVMWISSCCLLVGMTVENIMLLLTSPVGAHQTHEIYKYGMHICSMYAFCVIMNVATPEVYAQTRILLCIAFPAGSLIGLWQLWVLVSNSPNLSDDALASFAAFLFAWRAMCGFAQCIGLVTLNTVEAMTGSLEPMKVTTTESNATGSDTLLSEAISRGRFALFHLFLPAFVVYTATSALLSGCSEPMISPTILVLCEEEETRTFMLVPNWPGLGLFFHFAGLLVIFASDGLTTSTPSYPPSVIIGSLFALHVSILIAMHIVLELMVHPNVLEYMGSIGWQDWLRRMTLGGWMVSSFYLHLCLHRVWKLTQPRTL